MNILILGVGALGSNLLQSLVPDIRNKNHSITVMDFDTVEERNLQAGTQWYNDCQVGSPKVHSLQFSVYRQFGVEIHVRDEKLDDNNSFILRDYDLVIDCLDNHEGRKIVQDMSPGLPAVLHAGFGPDFTYSIEWAENYTTPKDIITKFDICEAEGAASFIHTVAGLTASVAEWYLRRDEKMDIVGNRFHYKVIK